MFLFSAYYYFCAHVFFLSAGKLNYIFNFEGQKRIRNNKLEFFFTLFEFFKVIGYYVVYQLCVFMLFYLQLTSLALIYKLEATKITKTSIFQLKYIFF